MCGVCAGMLGCAQVCAGVYGCWWVGGRTCVGVWAGVCECVLVCACVWDEFLEFLLENRVPTSADFNTYPIRIFHFNFTISPPKFPGCLLTLNIKSNFKLEFWDKWHSWKFRRAKSVKFNLLS